MRKICASSISASPKRGVGLVAAGHFTEVIYLISKTDLSAMGMRVLARAPRGSVLCEGVHWVREGAETEDGGREVGLCNVCDYVGNYSHPRDSDRGGRTRLLFAFTPSVSPRRRKGCNSLLARSGSGGGRGDYSPRSRFADDDKRESADPIAGPTRSLFSLLSSPALSFLSFCFFSTILSKPILLTCSRARFFFL